MSRSIDLKFFEDAISKVLFDEKVVRQTSSSATNAFLKEYSISKELADFLITNSFDRPLKLGNVYFNKTNDIESENLDKLNSKCLKEGLLIIGCGVNGDLIVVDIVTYTTGFGFHDELWDNEESNRARDIHVDLGITLGQFYFKAITQKNTFPCDANEAEELLNRT